jgi:hypothetical protein
MSKLQEKTLALKREHPAPQKMKFINFFLCLWVIFALLDGDTEPETPLNPNPFWIRIHSTVFLYRYVILVAKGQSIQIGGFRTLLFLFL